MIEIADTRFRSLLARRLFLRFAPPLARIPLEHGYPPVPASPFNPWCFSPLLNRYCAICSTRTDR